MGKERPGESKNGRRGGLSNGEGTMNIGRKWKARITLDGEVATGVNQNGKA